MADVVTSQTLVDTAGTKTVMKFTNMSDGSGETLVTKMGASALTFMTEDGTKSLAKIWWAINTTNGKSGVELLWSGSGTSGVNSTIGFFSGTGYHDYYTSGNSISNNATLTANTAPAGDILISTKGFVAGDNYTIILEVRQMSKRKPKDRSYEILERIVGTKSKATLAEAFKMAFAEKYDVKREEIKQGIVDKVYNKEKVEK